MKIETRWLVLAAMAVGTACGAAMARRTRVLRHREAHAVDTRSQVKSWENEGGNLAPAPASARMPS